MTEKALYFHNAEPKMIIKSPLTSLQEQAFRLAGDGLTHAEIGTAMGVSTSMAKDHIRMVRKKLGIENKRQLVPAARDYFA